jgi:hypothetical protein
MKTTLPDRLEHGRITSGDYASTRYDLFGAFKLMGPCGAILAIIATDGDDDGIGKQWEHVSVSTKNRPPNWQEMNFVKDLFWRDEETVVQYHPPKSRWVNRHPHCLHLWRHKSVDYPLPPMLLVG